MISSFQQHAQNLSSPVATEELARDSVETLRPDTLRPKLRHDSQRTHQEYLRI